ncbi:hypothetical protein SpCBS45565_g07823 [Spizellomyces sp. 'palustris']|nr:hypothetical protein SpCBS45565_g07823 [Spizellomyces sp. 'palustris']
MFRTPRIVPAISMLFLLSLASFVNVIRKTVPVIGAPIYGQSYLAELQANDFPKIIHQSWKTSKVPMRFQKWVNTWQDQNPEWTYILWTDEMNRQLIANHYPWALSTYDNLPLPIERADMVRYFYLHRFGGVYADLDMECLESMNKLIMTYAPDHVANGSAVVLLGHMSEDYEFEHNIPNAWMAGTPGHSFWMHMANTILEAANQNATDNAEQTTGPVALKNTLMNYVTTVAAEDCDAVRVLPPGIIYPHDWHDYEGEDVGPICWAKSESFDEVKCKETIVTKKAFTMTYWTHSWEGDWYEGF